MKGGSRFDESGQRLPLTAESKTIGRRFLQHYQPYYPAWKSTFKHTPPDSRHLLAPGPKVTRTYLLTTVTYSLNS